MNFYSCSGDGRVTNWTIVKTALWFSDLLVVNFTKELKNFKNAVAGVRDGVRTFAFKPDDDTVYLIGTEKGDIHLPLLYPSCTVLYCTPTPVLYSPSCTVLYSHSCTVLYSTVLFVRCT